MRKKYVAFIIILILAGAFCFYSIMGGSIRFTNNSDIALIKILVETHDEKTKKNTTFNLGNIAARSSVTAKLRGTDVIIDRINCYDEDNRMWTSSPSDLVTPIETYEIIFNRDLHLSCGFHHNR